jgi:hypothetical protein
MRQTATASRGASAVVGRRPLRVACVAAPPAPAARTPAQTGAVRMRHYWLLAECVSLWDSLCSTLESIGRSQRA